MGEFLFVEMEEKYWNQLESYIIQWSPMIEEENRRIAELTETQEITTK